MRYNFRVAESGVRSVIGKVPLGDAVVKVPAFVAPMLAHPLPAGSKVDQYRSSEWVLECKWDGTRLIACVGDVVETWSRPRAGQPALRKTIPDQIRDALAALPTGCYDGEYLVPGGRSWDAARLDNRAKVEVRLFDVMEILDERITMLTYDERRLLLGKAVQHIGSGPVTMPPSWPVSQEKVEEIWNAGGEGAILKRRTAQYHPAKRSWDWLKVKYVQTAQFTVTRYLEGLTGPHARLELLAEDGTTTSVKNQRNGFEERPDALIGRRVVVEYQGRTPAGGWRHPMFQFVVEDP